MPTTVDHDSGSTIGSISEVRARGALDSRSQGFDDEIACALNIIHVRTAAAPAAIVPELKRAIAGIDATVFADVRTLRDATGREAQLRQFGTQLIGTIGGVALLLATIGLYGMMAFAVSSRTREIGTRMALGADAGRILRNMLAQGLRLVAIGIAVGALLSWMLARTLRGALTGLSPADPIAFASAILVLTLTGVAAIYFPARRAAALNPVDALRVE